MRKFCFLHDSLVFSTHASSESTDFLVNGWESLFAIKFFTKLVICIQLPMVIEHFNEFFLSELSFCVQCCISLMFSGKFLHPPLATNGIKVFYWAPSAISIEVDMKERCFLCKEMFKTRFSDAMLTHRLQCRRSMCCPFASSNRVSTCSNPWQDTTKEDKLLEHCESAQGRT